MRPASIIVVDVLVESVRYDRCNFEGFLNALQLCETLFLPKMSVIPSKKRSNTCIEFYRKRQLNHRTMTIDCYFQAVRTVEKLCYFETVVAYTSSDVFQLIDSFFRICSFQNSIISEHKTKTIANQKILPLQRKLDNVTKLSPFVHFRAEISSVR